MPNERKFTQRNQAAGKGLAQQLPGAIKRQKAKSNPAASAAEDAMKTVKSDTTTYSNTPNPFKQ
jgi:hypothetical protein